MFGGQRARILRRRSKFESRRSLSTVFNVINLIDKKRKRSQFESGRARLFLLSTRRAPSSVTRLGKISPLGQTFKNLW